MLYSQRQKRNISGFTLIELLLVMMIIGIISGTAIWSYSRGGESELNRFSQLFLTKFDQLIDRSVATQNQYGLHFSRQSIRLFTFQQGNWQQASDIMTKTLGIKSLSNKAKQATKKSNSSKNGSLWLKIPKETEITLYVDDVLITLGEEDSQNDLLPHIFIYSGFESNKFQLKITNAEQSLSIKSDNMKVEHEQI